MISSGLKGLAIAGLMVVVAACSQVIDQRDGDARNEAQANPFGSYVEYDVDPGIVLSAPRRICVGAVTVSLKDEAKAEEKPANAQTVLDATDQAEIDKEKADKAKERAELPEMIRRSLVEHARMRLENLDIAVTAARPGEDEFAAALDGCAYWLTADLVTDDQINTLFWARRRLGVELRLANVETDETLWTARHTAARNEASVPLDPVSVVVGVFRTQDFALNQDILPSMVDDVMRRLFATFPALAPSDEPHRAG